MNYYEMLLARKLAKGELPPNAYLLKEASGSLVSFSDGADLPMPSFICNIDAQQDLHGYDVPWVGGAGKNKYNNQVGALTTNGVTFTPNTDGTVTVNGTATANAYYNMTNTVLSANTYVANGSPSGGSDGSYELDVYNNTTSSVIGADRGHGVSFSTNGTDAYRLYIRIANGYTANNLVIKPMIRLATETDDTFAPYSNICPISGHTGVEAVISPTTEASAGTTIPVSWESEAGEVFGGYVDLVSGVLTVTRVINRLQNVDYSQEKTGFIRVVQTLSASITNDSHNSNHDISNRFTFDYVGIMGFNGNPSKPYTFCTSANKIYAVLPYGSEDTLATINTWLNNNPTYICSTLATPQTYQLTSTQIKSLRGNNNAWCNTGDVTVEYFGKGAE